MDITTSSCSTPSPPPWASGSSYGSCNHPGKKSPNSNDPSAESESCDNMQESSIALEDINSVTKPNYDGINEDIKKNIVIKEEFTQPPPPPPHMLELTIPTTPAGLTKRRRTVLPIAEKADLIRRMHEGESQKQLALEYGIGTSTVSDLKKQEVKILRRMEENEDLLARNRRKLVSGVANADVDDAVVEWLLKEVSKGREISGSEVMARARVEHTRLRGSSEFGVSTGWLESFKRRYNIRAFKPGEESNWRRPTQRSAFADKRNRGKQRGRLPHTMSSDVHSGDMLEQPFKLPFVKLEIDNTEESEYAEYNMDEEMYTDNKNAFQPVVRLEEGHFGLNIPPVEEIPSAREVAILLSKALVWAAAQQDTTSQELFVIKELQTKAIMRSIGKN